MSDDPVLLDIRDEIATITLNRPERLNALDENLLKQLHEVALEVSWDKAIRGVIVTGSGRAFCAGGDLKALSETKSMGGAFHRLAGVFHQSVSEFKRAEKVVIGCINGPAAGGGLSLALACDIRIMSTDAFFQVAYVTNGLSIDGGGSWTLPRIVGYAKALEFAFTDEKIGAQKSLDLGLTNWICEPEQLPAFAREKAKLFAELPQSGIGRTKSLLNHTFDRDLEVQLEEERRYLAAAAESEDGAEGVAAFLEKRKPNYRRD